MAEPPPVSHLLGLPLELREYIWEEVLTSPTPLHYVRLKIDEFFDTKPRKVRYELQTTQESGRATRDAVGEKEFNQLKYVNRQLHDETTFLELKYNEIKFSTTKFANLPDIPYDMKRYRRERDLRDRPLDGHPKWATPLDQLITFISRLRKKHLAWLQNVILAPCQAHDAFAIFGFRTIGDLQLRLDFRQLTAFCEQNPTINIKYTLPDIVIHFGMSPWTPIEEGAWLSLVLWDKHIETIEPNVDYYERMKRDMMARDPQRFTDWKELDSVAPNFRLFPTWDKQDFEAKEQWANAKIASAPFAESTLLWSHLVVQMREWMELGFSKYDGISPDDWFDYWRLGCRQRGFGGW